MLYALVRHRWIDVEALSESVYRRQSYGEMFANTRQLMVCQKRLAQLIHLELAIVDWLAVWPCMAYNYSHSCILYNFHITCSLPRALRSQLRSKCRSVTPPHTESFDNPDNWRKFDVSVTFSLTLGPAFHSFMSRPTDL